MIARAALILFYVIRADDLSLTFSDVGAHWQRHPEVLSFSGVDIGRIGVGIARFRNLPKDRPDVWPVSSGSLANHDLEDRIYEGCQRRSLRHYDQHTEYEHDSYNGRHP